ncbi:MAG: proline iminopeptidase-family hydrolase [Gemmatimonadaceae bacterium]
MFLKKFSPGATLCLLATIAACSKPSDPPPSDSARIANLGPPESDIPLSLGEGRLRVDGGRIWFRVAGTGKGTPVILLHSGPGLSSYSLKSLEELGNDRPVARYDQLGGGKSDNLNDTTRMNISHFVVELEALRKELGYNSAHFIGHGWGATLALEYYRAHPEHVASLTFVGAMFDMPSWRAGAQRLIAALPDSSRKAVAAAEATLRFNTPEYRGAIRNYFDRYMWSRFVDADLDSSALHVGQLLFETMHGPSEFTVIGSLKDYNATSYLPDVRVPTLYVVGETDEAQPSLVRKYASETPGARFSQIAKAAHAVTWDNPTATNAVLRDFLNSVDRLTVGAPSK